MGMAPEAKVKHEIKKYLATLPNCWWFMPVSNGMGVGGIPDIIICYKGVFVGIETKAPGKEKTTTPLQRMQLNGIDHAHGFARVVSTVDEVRQTMETIDTINPLRI